MLLILFLKKRNHFVKCYNIFRTFSMFPLSSEKYICKCSLDIQNIPFFNVLKMFFLSYANVNEHSIL